MKSLKPIVLLSSVLVALPLAAEIIERVVAKVNGDIVTLSDFTARQVAEAQAARITPDGIEQFLRNNNARILQAAIDDLLIAQKAADLGMRLRPEYIAEVVENIKKENNIDSDEAFRQQLEHEGMSLDDLKRNIERSIITRQVISREVDGKVQVSEQDVRAEYEARKARYTTPAKLRLQEIVVAKDRGGAALARELVKRARGGEDFAQLAREYSTSASRAGAGDLGEVAHGELADDVEKLALGLPLGAISDPLPRGDVFLILRVAGRSEGSVTPYDDVKAELLKELQQRRRASEYEKFVAELRKNAIVDIRVREVPLQVDLPTSGSILEPPAAAGAEPAPAAPHADPQDEFGLTPQARPERVAPAPAPQPTPTPPPR